MPNLPDQATGKFLAALNDFMENPPRDLPEAAVGQLKEVATALKGHTVGEMSPGQKQALEAGGITEATGNHYSKAALGEDKPSPGQMEFEKAVEQMRSAATAMATSDTGA
jgi:hypothetical protein